MSKKKQKSKSKPFRVGQLHTELVGPSQRPPGPNDAFAKVEAPDGTMSITGPRTTGTYMSGRVGLRGASLRDEALDPPPSEEDGTKLPHDIAKHILTRANKMKYNPNTPLPDIPDTEVRRLITENPAIALEGMTRLGKVMTIPTSDDGAPPFNPLDIKARVIGDMRSGHVDNPTAERFAKAGKRSEGLEMVTEANGRLLSSAVQVDVTSVYDRWMAAGKGNDLYELKMAPPWGHALLVYNTAIGNVWAMFMTSVDMTESGWDADERAQVRWQPEKPADHTIDWDRVRWVYTVEVFVGGMGQLGHDIALSKPQWVQTTGPVMLWKIAVYEDGEPADVHWTHLVPEIPFHKFNNALGVFTETVNMLNCTNVTVAYPTRPMARPQRRRLDRMGVRFSEIHVRPTSKSYKGNGQALADMEMPLHGVRGHYATYGTDGRGLLFGRLSGRYWIPPHVRGTKAVGEVEQSYVTDV